MLHKLGNCTVIVCLFTLATAWHLQAQTITETNLIQIGVSSPLRFAAQANAGASNTPIRGIMTPSPRIPRAPAGALSLRTALSIPNPPGLPVTGPDAGFLGFSGLSTLTNGAVNGFVFEPPDQGLAVGNGFVLEVVNLQLAVFDAQSGQPLTLPAPLNGFFGLPLVFDPTSNRFGPFLADPRAYFDPDLQHWFVTALEIDTNPETAATVGRSRLLIAVSQTADVLGAYNLFSIETTDDGRRGTPVHPDCPCFPDQPLIGADRYGFFISSNEFSILGNGFNGAQIYAMSKQKLAAGTPGTVLHLGGIPLADGLAASVQPATSPDFGAEPDFGNEYFLSALDFAGTLDNRVAVWAMTNTSSLSELHPKVHLLIKILTSETYGIPPPAVQRSLPGFDILNNAGELEKLDTADDRMQQVVYAAGNLWSGLNTVIGTPEHPRAGIAYFVIQPSVELEGLSAELSSQGYVAVSGDSTMYPSIGVTSAGRAVMAMTLVGPEGTSGFPKGFFPSVAYTPLSTGHPEAIRCVAPGDRPDDSFAFDQNGVARWGDYTASVGSGNSIWLAGEFIPGGARYTISDWGTFIGRLE